MAAGRDRRLSRLPPADAVLAARRVLPLAELRRHPAEGPPAAFTFVIDAARVADETWLAEDRVFGFAPMGGQDQIELIADFIKDLLKGRKGRVGIESGMSNYLPEGNLTHYEFERFRDALRRRELVNAHDLVDRLSLIKDAGTINRFREASRIVDVGHAGRLRGPARTAAGRA